MVLFVSYFAFVDDVYEIMVAGPDILENPGMLWLGPVWFITFALRPINFVLFYLFIDGVFRAYFTLAGEVYGTFVLHAVGWIHLWLQSRYLEKSLGSRIADRVQWAEGKTYDLLIGTCRRKPRWDNLITVRYQDRLYEVLQESVGEPPYRFRYELRRNPNSRVTRKIYDYHPDEGSALRNRVNPLLVPVDVDNVERSIPASVGTLEP